MPVLVPGRHRFGFGRDAQIPRPVVLDQEGAGRDAQGRVEDAARRVLAAGGDDDRLRILGEPHGHEAEGADEVGGGGVAGVLERDVLPARLPRYSPRLLDELLTSGEVVWVGAGSLGRDDGKITLYLREQAPLLLPADLDFTALFHGIDERVPVDGLTFGVRVLDRFLQNC